MPARKDWRVDLAPLAFFAAVVGAKTYFLFQYLHSADQLWLVLRDPAHRAAMGETLPYYLTGEFSYFFYYLVATAFDALVLYSLWVRRAARERPESRSARGTN